MTTDMHTDDYRQSIISQHSTVGPDSTDRPTGGNRSKACCDRIRCILDHIFEARENQAARKIYRSRKGIQKENERRKQENRYILHPFSLFRTVWDGIIVFVLVFALLVQPVEVSFFSRYETKLIEGTNETETVIVAEEGHIWIAVNWIIDIIFLMDVIINFRTAYVDPVTEKVSFRNQEIIVNYLKGWFFIDLISSLPIDQIYTLAGGGEISQTLKFLRFLKLLSLLKFLRVVRLVRYITALEEVFNVEGSIIGIFHLLVVSLIYLHWNACVQYLVPFTEQFPPESWPIKFELEYGNVTIWTKYSFSLYRAVAHLLGMGYSQYNPPVTLTELWVGMLSYISGSVFYALFIAHLANLIQSINLAGKKYDEKIAEVKEYMRFRKVPHHLQVKMLEFYDHMYQRKYFDEQSILFDRHMSPVLRQEILLHNCQGLVTQVPFLANAPSDFIADVVSKLRFQVYFPDDMIIKAGSYGTSMYFIHHGSVDIQTYEGKSITELHDGDFFGEIALLLDQRRLATVVALEICDIYELDKSDFLEVVQFYPETKEKLISEARKRVALMTQTIQEKQEEEEDPAKTRVDMHIRRTLRSATQKFSSMPGIPGTGMPITIEEELAFGPYRMSKASKRFTFAGRGRGGRRGTDESTTSHQYFDYVREELRQSIRNDGRYEEDEEDQVRRRTVQFNKQDGKDTGVQVVVLPNEDGSTSTGQPL